MLGLIFAFVLAPIVSMYIPLLFMINKEYQEVQIVTCANTTQSVADIKVHEILSPDTHDSTYALGLHAIAQYVLIVQPV